MSVKLQLKRNASIYDGKDAATQGLSEALKNGANGEVMVAIYNDVNPYATEIPLYNTNGGETYIDWFNDNQSDLIDINDKFRVQFEGEWAPETQYIYYDNNIYEPLFTNETTSGWIVMSLPMYASIEGGTSNTLRTFDITYGLKLSNTYDQLSARYDYCYYNGELMPFSVRIKGNITSLYQRLSQLQSSQEERDNGARTDFFSLTYLPAKKILKTDLYADTTNYSDIQYI